MLTITPPYDAARSPNARSRNASVVLSWTAITTSSSAGLSSPVTIAAAVLWRKCGSGQNGFKGVTVDPADPSRAPSRLAARPPGSRAGNPQRDAGHAVVLPAPRDVRR